jgi:DNA-binding response OmpR family regulator
VLVRNDGTSALSEAMGGDVSLVVLDLGLPDMDGLEVCRRLRAGRNSVPVLVLTARTDEIDLVVGLDAGADDYVAKPFRLAELLARCGAAAAADRRRARGQRRADGAGLPPGLAGRRRAAPEQQGVRAAPGAARGGRSPSSPATGSCARSGTTPRAVPSKTLDMHVSWLRRKLGDDPQRSRLLTTVRGVGFRFERG